MNRLSFKNSIFNVVVYLNRYELSDQAKNLIMYYFNESTQPTSYLCAIEAIEKYWQNEFPDPENMPEKLKILMEKMLIEANKWDEK